MPEKQNLKKEIDHFIAAKQVFTATDEKRIFEKINKLENKAPNKIKALMPQVLSFMGIGILISIVVGVIVLQDGIEDSDENAKKSETIIEKKHEENQETKNPEENKVDESKDIEQEETVATVSNEYDLNTISIGDKVGDWTLIDLEQSPKNFKVRSFNAGFEGDVTLTGTLICLGKEEYGQYPGAVLFFPDDKSLLPKPVQEISEKPLLVTTELGASEKYNIKEGEKREGETIRIQKISNRYNPTTEHTASQVDYLFPYNSDEKKVSFTRENAPDTLIREGQTYIKLAEEVKKDVGRFAQRTGGVHYGPPLGTDWSIVLKDNKNILYSSLFYYGVTYEYAGEFSEIILQPQYSEVEGLMADFEKFLQTGESIKVDWGEYSFYYIYDLNGRINIESFGDE